jgi:iron complex outermembrane receptor protein
MDIDNLQATLTAGDCSSRVIINVPKARSMGLELEFAAAPSHHFDYSIALSYNDAELRSTFSSPTGDLGIRDGNRLPTVPEFQAVVAATYQWQMSANWLGYTTGTYQYVGSRFTQIGDQADGFGTVNVRRDGIGAPYTGDPFLTFDPELPSYDIVNLRVGFVNDAWDLAFFVNNVTDEVAQLSLDIERGSRARVGYLTNQPRTYGLSARVNF